MRLKNTVEFLGLWEILNNENFNRVEFDAFRKESGRNSFIPTPSRLIRLNNEGNRQKELFNRNNVNL